MTNGTSIGDGDNSDGSYQAPRSRQQPGAACDECRRRKLRCDRQKPQCGVCQTSGVTCVVPANKPSRGPKKGYLRSLQRRLSVLEGTLREQPLVLPEPQLQGQENTIGTSLSMSGVNMDLSQLTQNLSMAGQVGISHNPAQTGYDELNTPSIMGPSDTWFGPPCDPIVPAAIPLSSGTNDVARRGATARSGVETATSTPVMSDSSVDMAMDNHVQSDLDQLYLDRVHEFIPIIHHDILQKPLSSSTPQSQRYLRYAMWTLAASASPFHLALRGTLYDQTRKALGKQDENQNVPCTDRSELENVQAWLLIALHELKCVSFRRAWISAGKAFRLIQLSPRWATASAPVETDSTAPDESHQLDWAEVEQRRSAFWFAYCLDRFLSLWNASHPTLSDQIPVRLPCPEHAFQFGRPTIMGFLPGLNMNPSTIMPIRGPISPFSECIVAATVAGQVLSHRLLTNFDIATGGGTRNAHICDNARDRHLALDTLVDHNMMVFALHYPPAAQERDPMLLFLAISWRAIIIYQWCTFESISLISPISSLTSTSVAGPSCITDGQSSPHIEKTVSELIHLIDKLRELNSWKVHPLIALPLTLCIDLLAPRPDLRDTFAQKLHELKKAVDGRLLFPGTEICI